MIKARIKLLAAAVTVMVSTTILAGCSSKTKETPKDGGTTKKTVTLKVWGGVPEEYGPKDAIDNFNKEFKDKGIQAEYVRFVNDDQGNLKLDTALLSGSDVDVYFTYSMDILKKRASGNMALDLSKYADRDKYDLVNNYGELVKSTYIDGKAYSVPAQMANVGILINKDMFDAANIPVPTSWSLDEFRDISKKLTKGEGQNKVYGMYFHSAADPNVVYSFVGSLLGGNANYKADGKTSNFDDPAFEKSAQTVTDMMLVDKSAPSHIDTTTQKLTIEGMFLSGKAAMSEGVWITRSIKDKEKYPHTFKTAFAPFPTVDKSQAKYSSGGLGDMMAINPKSQDTDAAWTFVKWYNEKGVVYVAKGGRIPANKNVDTNAVTKSAVEGFENLIDATTFKSVMVDTNKNYSMQTNTTKAPEITKIQKEEAEAMMTGKKTVKQALDSLKKRADEMLKQQ